MKNLHSKNLKRKSKYCNANILELVNFCNRRIPNLQLATLSWQSYLCKNELNHMSLSFLFSSLFGKIWQLHSKMSTGEKKYVLIIGIWWINSSHLKCSAKIDILQNSCLTEYQTNCMIKIFEKYQWRSSTLVKWKASITCNFSKNRTLS